MHTRCIWASYPYSDAVAVIGSVVLRQFANNLGVMFMRGLGATKNFKTVAIWFKRAAEQGKASAQYNLGSLYEKGMGVSQNKKLAFEWYKRAAEQRVTVAQFKLGLMYKRGQGTQKVFPLAHMWWSIATKRGYKEAKVNRGEIERIMTRSQIEKARTLALECLAKNYKGC